MKDFSLIARLHNRRITLTRGDYGEGIVNCFRFKRCKNRQIIEHHIHLSDEALVTMVKMRAKYHDMENEVEQ